jgi:hypothetical protein
MEPIFTASADDVVAQRALAVLHQLGQKTYTFCAPQGPERTHIALFGSDAPFRNSFLRLATHRMRSEGFQLPEWASEMPFVVAVNAKIHWVSTDFRQALKNLAVQFASWEPWMRHTDAPWDPRWHQGVHDAFPDWRERAIETVPTPSVRSRLETRLAPVFRTTSTHAIERVLITGCALFNAPHTDVVAELPERTRNRVVQGLGTLLSEIDCPTDFIVPGPELLDAHLREHFHPFIFMAVPEVEKQLGTQLTGRARLFGRSQWHARSDDEIAQALTASREGLVRDVVQPLAERSGRPVIARAWIDIIEPYLDMAYRLAGEYDYLAERIYQKRVQSRPSYKSLHDMDPARGLRRTLANNVFYIAEALYLSEHPEVAIINCEHEDTFWLGLEEALSKSIWGDWRPLIGMVPKPLRQPWGY